MGQHCAKLPGLRGGKNAYETRRQLDPDDLRTHLRPLYVDMLSQIGYTSAIDLDPPMVDAVYALMCSKANASGIDYTEDAISAKAFLLGLWLACLCYPHHPTDVQAYIGIYTWQAVLIDDRIGEFKAEVEGYQRRFFAGEEQPTPLLRAAAALMRETWQYWDPLLANLIVSCTLDFVTSNLLDHRPEFQDMAVSPHVGNLFPYFFRNMSGLTTAFSCFSFPKTGGYPDIGLFLEALPDMALYNNIVNDVLSYFKEEAVGETHNYIHNRARCELADPLHVVAAVKTETVQCVRRIRRILASPEQQRYLHSWELQVMGMISMHKVSPRYRLAELGLGEKIPIVLGRGGKASVASSSLKDDSNGDNV